MAFDEEMKVASFFKEDEEQHYSLSRLSVCSNYDGDEADDEPSDSGGRGENRRKSYIFQIPIKNQQDVTHFRRHLHDGYGEEEEEGENEVRKPNNIQRRRRRFWPEYQRPLGKSNGGEEQSSHGGYGGGVVVMTRPIGGGRALCMDLGEVKACKDLGFELEPGRVSYSGSTMDTSSGGNSPIRISSPGDDPKDVKARLKAWAQAVAFVSTTYHQPPSPNSF